MPTSRPLPVLSPQRVRQVSRSFAWLDHGLRSDAFLSSLRPEEIGLYLFLALAADKQGLSCWRLERIERALPCFDAAALHRAREGLMRLDLLAFRPWFEGARDGSYQLLALPPHVPQAPRGGGPVSIGAVLPDLGGMGR